MGVYIKGQTIYRFTDYYRAKLQTALFLTNYVLLQLELLDQRQQLCVIFGYSIGASCLYINTD